MYNSRTDPDNFTFYDDIDHEYRYGDPVTETIGAIGMASYLEMISKGKQKKGRRVAAYGVHGVGKSTFANGSPDPIFIDIEGGLDDIDCASFPKATKLADVHKAIRTLYTEDHPYKTVVIDSLDWLERLIWEEVCIDHGVKEINEGKDLSYGKGYGYATAKWTPIIQFLDKLRDEKNMNIILLAHAKIERFENPETEAYDRYSPRLHKSASGLIQEWCDEVLFCTYKIYTRTTDEGGFRGDRTIGIGTGERIMRTSDRPAHVAKNRLGLPDEIPMLWSAIDKYIQKPAQGALMVDGVEVPPVNLEHGDIPNKEKK